MRELENLKEEFLREISEAKDLRSLEEIRIKYLGKKGLITGLTKRIKDLPIEERRSFGRAVNELKEFAEGEIKRRREELQDIEGPSYDPTLPGRKGDVGNIHPLTRVFNDIIDIFVGFGFQVRRGPEIETDWYNFTALNIPEYHPAREMQDTFYLPDGRLMRTHTSPVQIRVMEKEKPPIRIIAPGRVFRRDNPDATHSPVFHQLEGLYVDKNVTFAQLKGTLTLFLKKFYGPHVKVKFVPSYFPFTEPSTEVYVDTGNGWMEILGAGMVHQNVLKNVGIDPDEYSGFAFGLGIERIAMLKYGIRDIRMFYEDDIRFLDQIR